MNIRKAFLLVLVVLLTMSGAALAQDTGTVFCGDLAEADCMLLQQSQTAMMSVPAASFDLFLDVQTEADGQYMPISIVGSGSYAGMLPMGDMSADNMGSMEESLANLRAFTSELTLNVTLPHGFGDDSGTPATITLELRLVDGIAYANLDALQPIINDPSMSGWGGLDLASMSDMMGENPEMLQQMDGMTMFGVDPMMMQQFSDPAMFGEYIHITRTDDGTGDTAEFETTIDFAGLMSDPAFEDMMRSQMDAQMGMMGGEGMSDMDEDDMDGASRQMFENANFVVHQTLETATGLVRSVSVEFSLDMSGIEMEDDMDMMATDEPDDMMATDEPGDDSQMMGSVSMTAMINYNYDNVPAITAPENASIVAFEDIFGMFAGMMFDNMNEDSDETPDMIEPEVTVEPTAAG